MIHRHIVAVTAVVLCLIAVGVYFPAPAAQSVIVLAMVLAVIIWVTGEALGGILAGEATDPNSGPLLALLALAYWPARPTTAPSPDPTRYPAAARQEGMTA